MPVRYSWTSANRRLAGLVLLIVLTVGAPQFLVAAGRHDLDEEQQRKIRARLAPEELSWPVAVGVIVSEDHRTADRPVLGSYVRIVQELISDVPVRYLTDQERLAWAARQRDREIDAIRQRIDDRLQTLDRARLSGSGATATTRRVEDSRLRDLQEELRLLQTVRPGAIRVPRQANLVPLSDTYRYRRVFHSPGATADRLEVETLLYIQHQQIDDLTVLTIRSYSRLDRGDREILRLVAPSQEMPGRLEAAGARLIREIAGRDLARLQIEVTDEAGMPMEDAWIRLDDQLLGAGRAEERFLAPREYTITVHTDDGRTQRELVELTPGEAREVRIALFAGDASTVVLTSEPPGARVYQSALWQGFTPLQISRPGTEREFTISKDGYYDSRVRIGPDGPARLERVLVSTDTDWNAAVELSRDQFYRSFGVFALSLSVPILINGFYQNLGGLFPGGVASSDLSPSEQDAYIAQANTLLVGYYAGIGLSAGLFGNMLWRLVQYVRTAEEYHDR